MAGVPRFARLLAAQTYEVAVTTAGGLWRYRLGDCVQVTGFLGRTPSLRFIGRKGNVSDLFGEKLSDAFACKAIRATLAALHVSPRFVLLAPEEGAEGSHYVLYVEGEMPSGSAGVLDNALLRNPHYAHCRNLGQLHPPRVFGIRARGYETFVGRETANGRRLGDIKPCHLSRQTNWAKHFQGEYIAARGEQPPDFETIFADGKK